MLRPKVRATHCMHCGEEFGRPGRIDRTYCGESCRVLAYRERRQLKDRANGSAVPSWSETRQPLLHKTLAALADLQSQIVGIGHALQVEEKAERERRDSVTTPAVDHEAEKATIQKELKEARRQLAAAEKRIAELEGVVAQQSQTIRDLEARKPEQSKQPATSLQHSLHALAKEITRDEERWLIEVGEAIRSGYDPKTDRLLDLKFDELRAEQDLADAEERAGGVPSILLHRRGILLWPMAMWAALAARREEASRQQTGLFSSRPQIRWGQLLRPGDEGHLCELSAARTRDLMRKLPIPYRR
ncbi:MAG: hypothetical protein JNM83_24210 [Myxococcales bacterium]|nr:hypothetical protein [Myxococcales bacterium]